MKQKNKINNAFTIIGIMCLMIAISGCKKLITIDQPRSTFTTADVFTTDSLATGALAGIYSQLMTNSGNMIFSNGANTIFTGLGSDELVSTNGAAIPATYQFETNTLQALNTNIDTYFWKPAYHIIDDANSIIEGTAASASALYRDSTRSQITGECKFMRAYTYFYLTNLFGNVPLVLTADFNKTVALPNSTQPAIYKQITDDLLDAQSKLKSDYSKSGGERVRVNKWAATALLARAYLYQQDWKNAETQASAVIGNSQYALVSNLAAVFNKNSTEAIFQLKQNSTVTPFVGTYDGKNFIPGFLLSAQPAAVQAQYFAIFSQVLILAYPAYYVSPQLQNAFETTDKRKTIWCGYTPTPPAAPYNSVPTLWPNKYTVYTSSASSAASLFTQYYMVLRLGEQYLIRAEARAQQGNLTGAASDLNVIRTRAGLAATTATSQADLLTAIAHERQVELFAEGHRFFDLKRTGQANAVLGAIASKQPWNPNQLLYPIPPYELKTDAFLVQNPGY